MGRKAEPWRRGGGDWWITLNGRQVRLADAGATKTQAWAAYREILSGRKDARDGLTWRHLAEAYLKRQKARVARGDLTEKRFHLELFFLTRAAKAFGSVAVGDLKPRHVSEWLDGHATWGQTTRSDAGAVCRAVVRWAIAEGHIEGPSPFRGLRLPAYKKRSRDRIPRLEELGDILNCRPDIEWRDLIGVLILTGCRPGEVYHLTAADIDFSKGVMYVRNKTAKATGIKKRPVYLTDEALEILRRNAERHPDGEVLRNTKGTRWRDHAVRQAIVKAGFQTFPYAIRHSYGSRGAKTIDIVTLAKLMGHTRPKTTLENYVHNLDTDEEMRRSAVKVSLGIRTSDSPAGGDPSEPTGPATPKPAARSLRGKRRGGAGRS